MKAFILGAKKEQSQTFTPEGVRIPTTRVMTSPCYVISVNAHVADGEGCVKIGFGTTKNLKKPVQGELKKAGITAPLRFLREVRVPSSMIFDEEGKTGFIVGETKVYVGQEIKPETLFKPGDKIDVTGTSKGKGFQGVVKRHGFHGGPKTHGQSDRWRAPGSIGAGTTPGRILKGKRMAGRMGGETVTVRGLSVVDITPDSIIVKGLIPGAANGLLKIISQ